MAYYRFTRLQQYINGQPTDVYSKGERVDDVDYDTYDECMGGTTNTRWVSMPQTVCYNGDLWSMEKEQISYDSGSTWSDTGNTRRAAVIEPSASQCSGANNDWRVVYGEYICDGTSKCIKEAEYINNSPTGRTRAGSIVELLSGDCSVMYQWVDVPGEYVCVYKCGRADKYTKQKQQYSIDGGLHWDDTGETREGNFIEKNSADCGCDTTVTRWVTVSEEYVCVGTSKYTKEKEQTSTDGTNWTDTGNTRAGSLIEASSSSCISTRWITVDGQYSCVGYDKYNLEKEQQSTDGGGHWTDTGNTRAGSTLIEANSTDCGYVPQPITQWVTVPDEYVCDGYKKYTKEKEQISYDSGSTWTDTGNTRAGSEIEKYSVDCGYKPLYQWVADTGYVCVGYDKYNKEKQQISYDDGVTWEDTGVTRHGDTLIERNSEDCGYIEPIYQWVTIPDEYVCDGTTKYAKEKEQISYDSGSTWEDTGNTRAGSEIETESFDCGYVAYRWVADTGYMCVGYDKYNKEKEQSSTDGTNWTDTGNTRAGSNLIETLSTDCGVLYQWVTVSREYVCVGFDKYNKEKQQYSTDNGTTWEDTGNTRAGSNLIETLSTDCGVLYQWVTIPNDTICVGYDLYSREKQQYSTDNGTTWVDTGNTRTGSVIEQDSYDCGYDPSIVPLTLVSPTGINNLEFRHSDDVSSFEISYKYEDSYTWTRSTSDISINVPANKRVYFKGSFTTTGSIGTFYASSGKISVRGNIMSLIYNDNFLNQTSLSGKNYIFKKLFAMFRGYIANADKLSLPATTLSKGCYHSMFDNGWGLTKIPALPATTLTDYCYARMFNGCDHLLNVPTDLLPATTMAAHCYENMFSHCDRLINPPVLPATTLAESCYNAMFMECMDLVTAPELPATTLASSCYYQMFFKCYDLTVAPVLFAPTLVYKCYMEMFYKCTHLIDVTCCATDISATYCILGWLDNVASTGTFTKVARVTWPTGASGIPSGWTVQNV